jgi:mRNA interferase MazF
MKVQRGDVVLVNYPFADGKGSKVRPALVVQCDRNNARLDNTIIVQITSRTRLARAEQTQLLIEIATDVGQQSGLLIDSAVAAENLYTIRQDSIIRKLGKLPPETMHQVNDCLRASFELTDETHP